MFTLENSVAGKRVLVSCIADIKYANNEVLIYSVDSQELDLTLANSNLAITHTTVDFPWISVPSCIYSNAILGNSNPRYFEPPSNSQ